MTSSDEKRVNVIFFGSSAEFVGEFGFWKTTKCMKQGDPEQFEASIAVGFSHTQIDA